ncbi:fatty acid desaturase [Polychytrium aggregatum]|uniref:fatty acid desaturase n=1 Tax=Polychytrium aggregatum TaxID=110093 RepID=UPI0022FEBB10|nr:fatty acid desaturase [Polychytrium aggregatum]KAI9207038.1 fatty acid desaturase [Polychytrium aggregatum]
MLRGDAKSADEVASTTPLIAQKVTDDNVLQALEEKWTVIAENDRPEDIKPANLYERFVFAMIRDPRDLKVFNLAFRGLLTVVPSAALLIFWRFSWIQAIVHIFFVASIAEIYTLALHVSSHRPLFKPQFQLCNHIIPVVLGPFFGQTWYTYYWHHVKMHHPTDNSPEDLSTTLFYQRDSLIGFLHYFLSFYFGGMFTLSNFFYQRRRTDVAIGIILGELGVFALYTVGTLLAPSVWSAAFVFYIPFNLVRFGMMQGNFVQHAFLERSDPLGGGRENSITIIASDYNKNCYNDGYHASHHLNAIRHWTEHPREFITKRLEYHQEKAVVFQGTNYAEVWWFLMTKDYQGLAKKWVHCGDGTRPSDEKIVSLLKEKTLRFTPQQLETIYANKSKK